MISTCDGGEHSKGIGAQAAAPGNPGRKMPNQRRQQCRNCGATPRALHVPHGCPAGGVTVRPAALSIKMAGPTMANTTEEDMNPLEKGLRQLKIEYEQYFG